MNGKMALAALLDISKGYGAQQVLSSVKFLVGAGEKIAVVRPNGCGKGTAPKMCCSALSGQTRGAYLCCAGHTGGIPPAGGRV